MTGVRGQGGGFADGMTGFLRGGSAWHTKKRDALPAARPVASGLGICGYRMNRLDRASLDSMRYSSSSPG